MAMAYNMLRKIMHGVLCTGMMLAVVLLFSCKLGLGGEVDLEAPVLDVTSHENLDYVGVPFVLSGTARDNVRVESVTVYDGRTNEEYGSARIEDEKWSAELTLPEGDTAIRVVAKDGPGNSSHESVKQMTLMVDSTPPVIETVEISRPGGWIYYLQEREKLFDADESTYDNVDLFQNEQFTLFSELDDDSLIDEATVNLLDPDGNVLFSKVSNASSRYNPTWTITREDLTEIDSSYGSGRHYFRVTVDTRDAAGNTVGNHDVNTDQFLWLCWYPETDTPNINLSVGPSGSITVPKDGNIPVEFWDDDGLGLVHAALVPDADWDGLTGSTDEAKMDGLIADDDRADFLGSPVSLTGAPRQKVVTMPAGTTSGFFRLVLLAQDKKESADGVWYGRSVPVQVTDEEVPIVIIDNPAENTFPEIDGSDDFTIEGSVMDNRGATVLRIAWIPNGSTGGAESQLETVKTALSTSTVADGGSETLPNGAVIRGVALDAPQPETVGSRTYSKREFSIAYNILNDFMYDGSNENAEKLFVFYTNDEDNNEEWHTFRLPGNTQPPTVNFNYPENDLQVHSTDSDFDLEFEITTPGSLSLDSVTLEDTSESPSVSETYAQTGSTYSMTKTTGNMTGWADPERKTWTVTATDILGNEITQTRTVIFTAVPVLDHITSGVVDGTFKTGDVIMLQAVFSNSVRVTGTPRLRLRYSGSDTIDKYAEYNGGTGTNTLYFQFEVPAGADSEDLWSWTTPIDLNGGEILSTEGSGTDALLPGVEGHPEFADGDGNNLQDNKEIALDGVAPTISSLAFADEWYREGKTITVTLTLSESPLVSGDPDILLANGALRASFVRTLGNTVIFEYDVQSGDDMDSITWNLTSCLESADLATITDVAGNPLVLTATGTGSSGGIDTIVPPVPVFSSPSAGAYNTTQDIVLDTPATTGSPETTQYSLNGGFSWDIYSTPVTLTDGEHELVARRLDDAGNVSAYTASRSVEIGTDFPDIVAISCENPNGVYTEGETLTFKVSFDRPVQTTSGAAFMTVGDGTETQMASVDENPTLATALYFEYIVTTGDEFDPIEVRGLNLSGVQDRFGNTDAAPDITGIYTNRPGLRVDASAPQITSRTPAANTALARDGSGDSVITLNFDEPVSVESGTIEVYRYGNWLVPPVMTEDEFAEVFYDSALSQAQRDALMETDASGAQELDPLTGQPVGPYKKTTHGLVESGGVWVPDTSTKYVLDFTRDLDDADIRDALEEAGYHRYEVDVTSYRVTGSGTDTITITLPEPLPHGREWECVISAGSFSDAGGNTLDEESWRFWSDKTATPVVRIDRYSQGEGSVQPYDDAGGIGYETFGNRDKTTQPRGYVEARIDCETPGAEISYGSELGDSVTIDDSALAAGGYRGPDNKTDNTDDITDASISAIGASTTYSGNFLLGDGLIDTACKYYVAAVATKSASGTEPALTASDRGYEGAFKSILLYREPGGDAHPYTRFQGSNIEGGMPTISGFPLRDADPDLRFTKHAYQDGDDWYWHSWEIVSDWYNQSTRQNWQTNPNYILNSYGDYLYTYQKEYYGAGPWGDTIEP